MINERSCGILLHVTSLPAIHGVGDLGPAARDFVDWLAAAGQTWWQVLPLVPTDPGRGNNPYSSTAAFLLNPILISLEDLVTAGWLLESEITTPPAFPVGTVDYDAVIAYKEPLLERACQRFRAAGGFDSPEVAELRARFGVADALLYLAIKEEQELRPWTSWPASLRDREPTALLSASQRLQARQEEQLFRQLMLEQQYSALQLYARERGVFLFGDLPIYVDHDSADVWAQRGFFKLDSKGGLLAKSGVPPDYFSATGQLWGNPLYDWERLADDGYTWWLERLGRSLELFDLVRIDHFRAFESYWEVPASETTAIAGHWVPGPRDDFFDAAKRRFGSLAIVAEDLGLITDEVRALMERQGFPGMRVLLFAFGSGADNLYLPANHIEHCVVYTGTHDNTTARDWFEHEADDAALGHLTELVGKTLDAREAAPTLVRLALDSIAKLVVLPMQDVLNLDGSARMNQPGTASGNFAWRLTQEQLDMRQAKALHARVLAAGRLARGSGQ